MSGRVLLELALRLSFFKLCLGPKVHGARAFARSLKCAPVSNRLPACKNTVQAKLLNCIGSQSDSLKLDSLVLKTKSLVFKTRRLLILDSLILKTNSLSFRTRMPLKPDSIIPKTLLNRSPAFIYIPLVCSESIGNLTKCVRLRSLCLPYYLLSVMYAHEQDAPKYSM